jgi:diguanylate cyclase (GGDEF)-like protein
MSAATQSKRLAIIADDEDLGRLLLGKATASVGLDNLSFANGADALDAALKNDVAIVLLDVDMPGMNGNEVCRRLRGDPRFSSVPIVMVTGHQDSAAVRSAFEAGATDFVSKPVNWALLPHRLEYILRNAAQAEHIERLAYYDTLTGLPNRRRCVDLLGRSIAAAKGSGEAVAVIYLDLNNFKRVNDTFGHSVGDEVLRTVSDRLTSTLAGFAAKHPSVLLARFGGDEFVIAVRHAQAREIGMQIATACSDAFAEPIVHDSLEFYSAPSVGIAVFPDDGADVATVLKHADTAMYQAKSGAADPIAVYAPAMSNHLEHWLELEAKLRRAVDNDLLTLMFQPKFSLANNRLVGVEALVRWCDDEYGDIPPSRFVQIAEDSGLIIDMSAWVVRAACRQLKQWLDRGLWIPVAINCSGKELLHGDPARVIETEAAAAGVPTSLIEVEITESLLVNDSTMVKDVLQRIRDLGCHIALDDFGTGYSSLAYITRFPPDRIKIDRAFVRDVDRSTSDGAVANAILSLAKSLSVTVTAEGIERPEQLEWLRSRGCHEAQGYLLSRPLTPAELDQRFLSQGHAPPETQQDDTRRSRSA